MTPRSIRISDADWAAIKARAAEAGEDVSTYVRRRALTPDRAKDREAEIRRLRGALDELGTDLVAITRRAAALANGDRSSTG